LEIPCLTRENRGGRLAQRRLAEEVTRFIHGDEGLAEAERITSAVFSGNVTELSGKEIEDAFRDDTTFTIAEDKNVVDLLAEVGLCQSKSEARKLVQGGGISVNGEKITDFQFVVKKENAIDGMYSFIKKGKKNHALVKHE
jgi:tyrosyl-tRNA synthetase